MDGKSKGEDIAMGADVVRMSDGQRKSKGEE